MHRQPRRFWEKLVAEVEREGSVGEVARRRGVKPRTLTWWCWKLRTERSSTPGSSAEPRLLPIVLRDTTPQWSAVPTVVVEVGELRVRVEPGTDVGYVAALVGALRAC